MILYLSCTGNTLWAVRQLAAATGERIINIPDCPKGPLQYHLADNERLGLCFPVHGWRVPKIVCEAISRLDISLKGHYVYSLCTCGDDIGETFDLLRKQLAAVNIPLHASCSLIMPETYVGLPFMDVDTPQKEQAKIKASQKILTKFIDMVVRREPTNYHIITGQAPHLKTRVLGGYFTKRLITDKPFRVDSQRCVKCGICTNVCPVHNILGSAGKEPQWLHNGRCLACFSCYHHCPQHAIKYGWRTKGKGQYFFGKRKKNSL